MPEFPAALGAQIGTLWAGEQNPYGRLPVLRWDRERALQSLTAGYYLCVNCWVVCPDPNYAVCMRQITTKRTSRRRNPKTAWYS